MAMPPRDVSAAVGSELAGVNPSSNNASASLVTACYTTLTTAPVDTASLEQLPQHVLVQLLAPAVADREQAKAVCKQQELELAKHAKEQQWQYVINPRYIMDRVDEDMYDRVDAVTAKWIPRVKPSDFTASSGMCNVLYNTETKTFCFNDIYGSYGDADMKDLYQVISSPLLLYRICCLFGELHIKVLGPAGYKVAWEAEVQHVASGESIGFSEWKGAAMVRVSRFENPKEFPKEFKNDMLELLNLICDERCPHPYDGTVAGTVA